MNVSSLLKLARGLRGPENISLPPQLLLGPSWSRRVSIDDCNNDNPSFSESFIYPGLQRAPFGLNFVADIRGLSAASYKFDVHSLCDAVYTPGLNPRWGHIDGEARLVTTDNWENGEPDNTPSMVFVGHPGSRIHCACKLFLNSDPVNTVAYIEFQIAVFRSTFALHVPVRSCLSDKEFPSHLDLKIMTSPDPFDSSAVKDDYSADFTGFQIDYQGLDNQYQTFRVGRHEVYQDGIYDFQSKDKTYINIVWTKT